MRSADKPVQADLLTGDKESNYELRWFSLLPVDNWSNEYFTPTGDSVGLTKVYLYNPGPSSATITYDYLASGVKKTSTLTLAANRGDLSATIPTGSGAYFKSSTNFIALSMTDFVTDQAGWHGQIYDWGTYFCV